MSYNFNMSNIDFSNFMQYFLYAFLATALIISSITDLYHRRIPNFVTFPAILTALFTYSLIGGVDGFLFSLSGLGAGFIFFLLPYLMGGMGAGDVKLMGAVGAVFGFKYTVVSLLFIAVSGGILAVGMMVYRQTFKATITKIFLSIVYLGTHGDPSLLKIDKTKIVKDGIPFGVAITSGVFLFFIYLAVNKETLPVFGIS